MNMCKRFLIALLAALLINTPLQSSAEVNSKADEDYYTANALYNKGLYEVALKQYRGFLSKFRDHPKRDRARLGMALCLYSLGRYREASSEFSELLNSKEIVAKSHLRLLMAQCHLNSEEYANAEKLFRHIIAEGPAAYRPKAAAALVEALYRQKKWEQTATAGMEMLDKHPDESNVQRVAFQCGTALYNLDKYAEAEEVFSRIVKDAEKGSLLRNQAVFLLAECRRETGKSETALENYREIVELEKSGLKPEALYRIGRIYFDLGDFDKAAKSLQRFTQDHSDHKLAKSAKLYLGRSHLEKGDSRQAENILKSLVNGGDTNPAAVLWLGQLHLRNKDYRAATETLDGDWNSIGNDSLKADLMYSQASALMGLEEYKSASEIFNRIAKEQPDWKYLSDCLMRQALCTHYIDDYEQSLSLCNRFLKNFPDNSANADLSYLKAENLYLLDRRDKALAAYREFLSDHEKTPAADKARLRMAEILHGNRKWQEALNSLDSIENKDNKGDLFKQTDFLAGDIHFEQENWKKAREHLKKFTQNHPDEPNLDVALFKLARACEELGEPGQAIVHFETLTVKCKDSENLPGALINLGRLHCQQKQYGKARQHLQRFISNNADNPMRDKADYYLGWAILKQDDPNQARPHFEHIGSKFPESELAADALFHLGNMDMETGDYASAANRFGTLAEKHPDYDKTEQVLHQQGIALIRQKKWEPAAACFEQVHRRYPKSPLKITALYNQARCRNELGDSKGAADIYSRIVAEFPDSEVYGKAALNLAELLYAQQDYAKAAKHIDAAIENVDDDELKMNMLYRRGWCRFDQDEYEKAAEDFEMLASRFPGGEFLAEAEFQAGEARLELGENAAAREHFASAVQKAGEDKDLAELALLRLGETQALTKQWTQARQSYQKFISHYGKSDWVNRAWLGLGWSLENSQKYDEAIRAYRTVVDSGSRTETAARAQFQIGECEFARKAYGNAIAELVRVDIKYTSRKWGSKASLELGRIFEAQGEAEKAKEQYRETIEKYEGEQAAIAAESKLNDLK